MSLVELKRLAEEALRAPSEGDAAMLAIERYATAFDQFGSKLEDTLQEDELRSLYALHSKVLARAEKLTAQARVDLENLRKRGKGILTYAETLRQGGPDKTRPRKG